MKELSIERMEGINGGNAWDCVGFGLAVVGLGAAAFASGPIGWAWGIGVASGAAGGGLSGFGCIYDIVW